MAALAQWQSAREGYSRYDSSSILERRPGRCGGVAAPGKGISGGDQVRGWNCQEDARLAVPPRIEGAGRGIRPASPEMEVREMTKIVTEEEIRERLRKKGYTEKEIDALIEEYKEVTCKIKEGAA